MATPMQDPPASGEDVTAAELDEVEREFTGQAREMLASGTLSPYTRGHLLTRALALLPRLARAYRAVCAGNDAVEAALREEACDAHARGRREAIEEAARYLRDKRELCVEKLKAEKDEGEIEALELCRETLDAAAEGIENHEAEIRARGSK